MCNNTLKGLAEKGTVRSVRLGAGGKRLYHLADVRRHLGITTPIATTKDHRTRAKIVYARVSSKKQEADLNRQREALVHLYPQHEVVTDIASGINFKRRGLVSILDRALCGGVEEVIVAHRDRLCRFAFDLIEHVLRQAGVRLVVLDSCEGEGESDVAELQEDLLAIATVFVASNNGKRAARNRRLRREEAAREAEAPGQEGKESKGGRQRAPEEEAEEGAKMEVYEGPPHPHTPDSGPKAVAQGRL
jgi:predicted site-specific integrase-resolvase